MAGPGTPEVYPTAPSEATPISFMDTATMTANSAESLPNITAYWWEITHPEDFIVTISTSATTTLPGYTAQAAVQSVSSKDGDDEGISYNLTSSGTSITVPGGKVVQFGVLGYSQNSSGGYGPAEITVSTSAPYANKSLKVLDTHTEVGFPGSNSRAAVRRPNGNGVLFLKVPTSSGQNSSIDYLYYTPETGLTTTSTTVTSDQASQYKYGTCQFIDDDRVVFLSSTFPTKALMVRINSDNTLSKSSEVTVPEATNPYMAEPFIGQDGIYGYGLGQVVGSEVRHAQLKIPYTSLGFGSQELTGNYINNTDNTVYTQPGSFLSDAVDDDFSLRTTVSAFEDDETVTYYLHKPHAGYTGDWEDTVNTREYDLVTYSPDGQSKIFMVSPTSGGYKFYLGTTNGDSFSGFQFPEFTYTYLYNGNEWLYMSVNGELFNTDNQKIINNMSTLPLNTNLGGVDVAFAVEGVGTWYSQTQYVDSFQDVTTFTLVTYEEPIELPWDSGNPEPLTGRNLAINPSVEQSYNIGWHSTAGPLEIVSGSDLSS